MRTSLFSIKLAVACGLVAALFSCRKDIQFDPADAQGGGTVPIDPNLPSYENWELVPSTEGCNTIALAPHDERMYYGSKCGNYWRVMRMNTEEETSQTCLFGLLNSELMDVTIFNDKVYFSGRNFTSYGAHLFYSDPAVSDLHGLPISNNATHHVKDLQVYQGKLVFTGEFPYNNFITTRPIDQLTTNNQTTGMWQYMNYPNGLFADSDNDLYAFGKGNMVNSPSPSNIARWDGAQWKAFNYSGYQVSASIQSLVERNDTIYFTTYAVGWGGGTGPYQLMRIAGGEMTVLQDIVLDPGGILKVCMVYGKIYAFGQGLSVNGTHTNVLKLEGNTWTFDKIILETVNDVEYFNGHLYAATTNGLYRN